MRKILLVLLLFSVLCNVISHSKSKNFTPSDCKYKLEMNDTLENRYMFLYHFSIKGLTKKSVNKLFKNNNLRGPIKLTKLKLDSIANQYCEYKNFRLSKIQVEPDTALNNLALNVHFYFKELK